MAAALAAPNRGPCYPHMAAFRQQRIMTVRRGRPRQKEWRKTRDRTCSPDKVSARNTAWGHSKTGQMGREVPRSLEWQKCHGQALPETSPRLCCRQRQILKRQCPWLLPRRTKPKQHMHQDKSDAQNGEEKAERNRTGHGSGTSFGRGKTWANTWAKSR